MDRWGNPFLAYQNSWQNKQEERFLLLLLWKNLWKRGLLDIFFWIKRQVKKHRTKTPRDEHKAWTISTKRSKSKWSFGRTFVGSSRVCTARKQRPARRLCGTTPQRARTSWKHCARRLCGTTSHLFSRRCHSWESFVQEMCTPSDPFVVHVYSAYYPLSEQS